VFLELVACAAAVVCEEPRLDASSDFYLEVEKAPADHSQALAGWPS